MDAHGTSHEVQIGWSKQGIPGSNGTSPTVQALAVGDGHCATGGAAITDAAGHTAYVCSGQNGHDGTNGQPFAGTFTSPNGEYSISVGNGGIVLSSPVADVTLSGATTRIQSAGTVSLDGTKIQLNGCDHGVARFGDIAVGDLSLPSGGGHLPFFATIALASTTVCTGG